MVGAVDNGDAHIAHRIAGQHARFHSLTNAFFNGRDIFSRNGSPHHFIHKLKSNTRFARLNRQHDVTVLTTSAGLLNIFPLCFRMTTDRLTVRHFRLTNVRFYFKFTHQSIDNDLQMQLAHA